MLAPRHRITCLEIPIHDARIHALGVKFLGFQYLVRIRIRADANLSDSDWRAWR